MTKHPNLEDRIAQLERRLGAGRGVMILLGAGLLVTAIFGAVQLQRINESLATKELSKEEHFWRICQQNTTADERTESFLALLRANNSAWKGANLHGLQLRGVELVDKNLQGADLEASELADANLARVDLRKAILNLCDFSNVDLSHASLASATMVRSDMSGANFREAKMQSASLQQSVATGATFVLADLSDADLLMCDLSDCQMTGANLSGSICRGAKFRGANLSLANFSMAMLTNVDFQDSNWWRAVGFSTNQIEDYIDRFPPSDAVADSLKDDYVTWLQSLQKPE